MVLPHADEEQPVCQRANETRRVLARTRRRRRYASRYLEGAVRSSRDALPGATGAREGKALDDHASQREAIAMSIKNAAVMSSAVRPIVGGSTTPITFVGLESSNMTSVEPSSRTPLSRAPAVEI